MIRPGPSPDIGAVRAAPVRSRCVFLSCLVPAVLLLSCLLALSFPALARAADRSGNASSDPSIASLPRLWVDRPLESVEVEGLRRTDAVVVRRELRVRAGDVLDWRQVASDRFRLLDTGLFAEVRTEVRRDSRLGRPVLTFRLEERPSLALLPLLQYDPEDGWSYGVHLGDRNFRGRAERLAVSGLWGEKRGAALAYAVPWVAKHRIGLGASVFLSDQKRSTERIRERKYGVAWSVSPARDYQKRTTLYGGEEQARTRPIDEADPLTPPREREDHRWLGVQLSLDTRDYRVQARRGLVLRASLTQHGGPLGGDADFVRYTADALISLPTPRETAFTLASRASISDGPVPTYLRQNLGGVNTLRGYPQGRFGGESRWIGWAEERLPLLDRRTFRALGRTLDFALDAALFVDVGAIWDGNALLRGDVRGRWGAGAGFRMIVPWVDLVRIDVGTNGERVEVYAVGGIRL